jgi:hypothetical protein
MKKQQVELIKWTLEERFMLFVLGVVGVLLYGVL